MDKVQNCDSYFDITWNDFGTDTICAFHGKYI
jgi:hypothetical protein